MDALPALAAELVRIPVNVIVTDSTSGTLDAFAATRAIPIVMGASGGDPVALGLAKSLSRPGFNVTGTFFLSGLSDKRLQLLKQAFPAAQRIAVWQIQRARFPSPKCPRPRRQLPGWTCALFRLRRARPPNCAH
jgi:ABC-type uncharacterized transport system substrate-binding protein